MWAQVDGEHVAGAAKRRRERRHRAYLKYARMSVAMALSEYKHHTSRGQRLDRAGGWERAALHGHVPEHPTPQAAGTEYFSLDVEDVPAAGLRPGVLAEPRPQERVQRHTVEHIVDLVRVAPMVQILDAPVPQTVEQLPDILRFFDTLMPDPEQVIEVPQISHEDVPMRAVLRDTQLAEQLVEVPTNPGYVFYVVAVQTLGWRTAAALIEQYVDNPASGGGGGSRGGSRGPRPERDTARPGRYRNTGQG